MRFAGTLRFAGDVLAHFDCGVDTADRAELEVVGSEGALLLRDPFHSLEPVIEVRGGGRLGGAGRGRARTTRTPASCATSPRRSPASGRRWLGREDAVGQARAIAALYESAASGARVGV